MDKILLLGTGNHSKSCIDVIKQNGKFKIAGLVSKDRNDVSDILGFPVIGSDSDLQILRNKFDYAIIATGQIKTPKTRIKLFKTLKNLDFKLPIINSPRSYISSFSKIGEGTIIMHNAVINANAIVGVNCIINSMCLLEHDSSIGNHCHISTGSMINGGVSIGDRTFIGSGVVTRHSISIGQNCVVDAGVTLKENIDSNQIIKS